MVGYEVAGSINAVGEGVSEERLGQPVLAMPHFGVYIHDRKNVGKVLLIPDG